MYGPIPTHIASAIHDARDASQRFRWANAELRSSDDRAWSDMVLSERSDAFRALGVAVRAIEQYSPGLATRAVFA
ncbi:hypothetical protein ACFV3R_25085 [Streptomyces sp. NPDC059740]|uniref:hypothetical protein n=1 Tax=Streptomyces sp. NPDC059740 TaxID=3346926 RepID=UPI003652D53C